MVMLMAAKPFARPAQDGEVSKARGSRLTAHLTIAGSMPGQCRYSGPVRGISQFANAILPLVEHQRIAPQLLNRCALIRCSVRSDFHFHPTPFAPAPQYIP